MKLITKTRSYIPLVMGLVGGILGIVGGLCSGVCIDAVVKAVEDVSGLDTGINTSLMAIGGYGLLLAAIVGLVGGCLARSKSAGCLILLISGIISLICYVLLIVTMKDFIYLLPAFAAAILLPLGGILGMTKPKLDQPAVEIAPEQN